MSELALYPIGPPEAASIMLAANERVMKRGGGVAVQDNMQWAVSEVRLLAGRAYNKLHCKLVYSDTIAVRLVVCSVLHLVNCEGN